MDATSTIRPAATVMVVRDGRPGGVATAGGFDSVLEVLMVQRNLRSDFVGGAFVFPGGGVDPSDGGEQAAQTCPGRSDEEASRILGIDHGGLAYWVAVIRECFEEAGVLLADHRSSLGATEPIDDVTFERIAAHRDDVNNGRRQFLDVCEAEGLALAVDRVHYFAHWITPEGAPRRYDTRFFVAAAPPGQAADHDSGETVAARWIRPTDALALHREGEIELIFPTIRNLQAIERFATSDELVAAAMGAAEIPTILPRVVVDGRGVRIALPGDPGYDDAVVPNGPPPDFNAAVRRISHAANPDPDPAPPSRD